MDLQTECGGEGGGETMSESDSDLCIPPQGSEREAAVHSASAQRSGMTQGSGVLEGTEGQREGVCVYRRLIRAVVHQKLMQHCKAIIHS